MQRKSCRYMVFRLKGTWSVYRPIIVSHRSKRSVGSHPCRVISISCEQVTARLRSACRQSNNNPKEQWSLGWTLGVSSAASCSPKKSPQSGDVKGMITAAVRCHFVPNDVRRHRLISGSYISLLPCHGRGRGFESRRPRHSFQKELGEF